MSETPLPEPRATTRLGAGRLTVVVLALAALVVAGVGLSACGSDDESKVVEIVVPLGTAERLAAGEDVVLMPARLEMRVGDSLYIRNEDVVEHSVGPYVVKPDSANQFRYGRPGVYEGYCPVSEGDRYEIVVTS